MNKLLFWLALPFLIPQALWVRRTAPRFAGADGRADGAVGEGPPVMLYAVGDSIIAGVGATDMSRALVAQTAEFLAAGLDARVQW
ncbi:MAG: SGNH/GDSL hydrolase family protein, partial [Gammaproteobacteria bacterium]|nr:SGNH/GDSL hydrolase family protein [Gammaproteobacteria bacterium]